MSTSAVIWIVVVAVVIGWICGSRWAKGHLGEWRIRFVSWVALNRNIYHRLDNVMLRTPDGATQIDHIFVSRFGVFVLETKNMQGWIFGNEEDAKWTQKIYRNTFRFQNPLRQNFKHVKAVEQALQIPPETIHSIVAFVGNSTFKTKMPQNVTSVLGFISYVKSFQRQVFTEEQVARLLNEIEVKRLKSEHILNIKHVHNLKQRSNPKASRRCPKCGSPLVIRTAKQGAGVGRQFWGCSAYPKCRFTQNIA